MAVEVYPAKPGKLVRTVPAVGSLRSRERTDVTAEIAGKITFLDIPEGKRIKKGHVLARLDASTWSADLAVAKARLDGARDTLERTRTLESERLVPEQLVDDASNAESVAQREVVRQQVTVQKTVVRAPFDGTVGIRDVSLGAYVTPGTPITTLTGVDALELVFSVPERHVARLAVGQSIRGVVGACTHRFSGTIVVLEPSVDPGTRTLRAVAAVEDQTGALRPGMSASIRVEYETVQSALTIPLEAIVRRGTQELAYVVDKGGTVELRTLKTGDIDVRLVEILGGIAAGDRVITAGHQKVRPGTKVAPAPYKAIENPNLELGAVPEEADCWF